MGIFSLSLLMPLLFLIGGSSSNASVPQSIDNAPPVTSPPICNTCFNAVPEPANIAGVGLSIAGMIVLLKRK